MEKPSLRRWLQLPDLDAAHMRAALVPAQLADLQARAVQVRVAVRQAVVQS
jgi:hypothetical protein